MATSSRQLFRVSTDDRGAHGPPLRFIAKLRHYLRVIWTYLRRRVVLEYVPEDISLEVTNVCNFRCRFCPQSAPQHHRYVSKTYLSPQRAELILGRLRAAGVRTNVIHWTHDGEPFVNKRFHEICAVAARYGFTEMYFATDGMLCTRDRLEQLPRGPCAYTFTIDFSADAETFETIRGTPGSWARVAANIRHILNAASCRHIVVELREITPFSVDAPDRVATRQARLREMFPTHPRLRLLSKTFHNACGFLPAKRSSHRYHLCPYPWTSLSIAANGNVVACSRDLRHQTVLGNILHQDLWEIWNGAPMRRMRRNLIAKRPDRNGACAGCDMPYAKDKFALKNIFTTLRGRLRLFT
ncbi:MAG: radical SAM/SPASM domain-containing protein [Alphaproteobacteria bacterium]